MAIGIYFPLENLHASTYRSINARLCDLDNPAGRLYHAAFAVGDGLHIFDVWESMEDFEAFGTHLVPLLEEHGVGLVEPRIGAIERIVVPDSVPAS